MFFDLTRPLTDGMPVYPGDPAVRFRPHAGLAREGYRVTEVTFGTHAGTHLDAPAHFLPGGAGVDRLPLEVLIGPARVVDRNEELPEPAAGDRLLLRSGWGARWGDAEYFEGFPPLDRSLAARAAAAPLALLGLDTPSLHPEAEEDARLHRQLLESGVVIVENLVGLERLPGVVMLAVLPLALAGLDGAPCRAVAWVDDERMS